MALYDYLLFFGYKLFLSMCRATWPVSSFSFFSKYHKWLAKNNSLGNCTANKRSANNHFSLVCFNPSSTWSVSDTSMYGGIFLIFLAFKAYKTWRTSTKSSEETFPTWKPIQSSNSEFTQSKSIPRLEFGYGSYVDKRLEQESSKWDCSIDGILISMIIIQQ